MFIIGITGGIGAGKSKVLKYIKEHCNCRIILADDVGNLVKEPGEACYEEIIALLGKQILDETGHIHKGKMAERIFGDPKLLAQVNGIIHPAVEEYILRQIEEERRKQKIDVFFLEAALLIEAGYTKYLDELWYIYSRKEVRRKRLKAGRQYSDEKIDQIMDKQLSEDEFRASAQVVLDNSDAFKNTCRQIQRECERLKIWKE